MKLLAKYVLPTPPLTNHMFIFAKTNGRRFLNPDYRKFKRDVASLFKQKLLEGDLEMHLRWYRPRQVGDVDGRIKATMDSLEGIAYENDKMISKLVVERFEDKKNPRMEVEIYQYDRKFSDKIRDLFLRLTSSCNETDTNDIAW